MILKVYQIVTLVVFLLLPLFFIVYVYVRVCIEMKRMSAFKTNIMTPTTTTTNYTFERETRKVTFNRLLSKKNTFPY